MTFAFKLTNDKPLPWENLAIKDNNFTRLLKIKNTRIAYNLHQIIIYSIVIYKTKHALIIMHSMSTKYAE